MSAEYGCAVCKPTWQKAVVLWMISPVSSWPICATHAMLFTQQSVAGERKAPYAVRDIPNVSRVPPENAATGQQG